MSKSSPKKLITFVIPVYNEEDAIPSLTKEITQFINKNTAYDFDVIYVENGSHDKSYKMLEAAAQKDPRIKILQLSRNFECDGGIAAGLHYVQGDACVVMMADLQEPLSVVKDFLKKWEEGYEIVYGIVKKRTASPMRNWMSVMYYKLLNLATHNAFPEGVSDFRLIDRHVVEAINNMPEQNKYLRGLVMWTGFKHTGIAFDRKDRVAGESKANLITVLRVAKNGIFSFSYLPLRVVSYIGVGMTIISFIMIVFYLVLYFIQGREAPGIISIILLLLFLFGILFFILGIISEYIARIYEEAKHRPTYIVRKMVNL
ncbi:glycosyltransferase family 2 protein [soil metagenome]